MQVSEFSEAIDHALHAVFQAHDLQKYELMIFIVWLPIDWTLSRNCLGLLQCKLKASVIIIYLICSPCYKTLTIFSDILSVIKQYYPLHIKCLPHQCMCLPKSMTWVKLWGAFGNFYLLIYAEIVAFLIPENALQSGLKKGQIETFHYDKSAMHLNYQLQLQPCSSL